MKTKMTSPTSEASAQALANKIAADLGDNWMPVVYEQYGWHGIAKTPSGRTRVHYGYAGGTFVATVGGMTSARGDTPRLAVKAAIELAMAGIAETESAIQDAVGGLKLSKADKAAFDACRVRLRDGCR